MSRNSRRVERFTAKNIVVFSALTSEFANFPNPLRLRREPDSYYHGDKRSPSVTLPVVKWLERPDP